MMGWSRPRALTSPIRSRSGGSQLSCSLGGRSLTRISRTVKDRRVWGRNGWIGAARAVVMEPLGTAKRPVERGVLDARAGMDQQDPARGRDLAEVERARQPPRQTEATDLCDEIADIQIVFGPDPVDDVGHTTDLDGGDAAWRHGEARRDKRGTVDEELLDLGAIRVEPALPIGCAADAGSTPTRQRGNSGRCH